VATLAVGARVGERFVDRGDCLPRRVFENSNCASDDDFPLGFAVILSRVEKSWAVACSPGQFLPRTELVKRSLGLDGEQTWWRQESLQLYPQRARDATARLSGGRWRARPRIRSPRHSALTPKEVLVSIRCAHAYDHCPVLTPRDLNLSVSSEL